MSLTGLSDSNFDGRSLAVSRAVINRESIRGGFVRRNVYASAERRPHRLFRLRLDLHGLRIGNAVAKRAFLSGQNDRGIGCIRKNVKAVPAHGLESLLI